MNSTPFMGPQVEANCQSPGMPRVGRLEGAEPTLHYKSPSVNRYVPDNPYLLQEGGEGSLP